MKKLVKIFTILVIIFLLDGCSPPISQNSVASSIVSGITFTCESCDTLTRRVYTSPEKLRFILLCLRKLGPDFPPGVDVDAIAGKTLHIVLDCADGSRVTYRIKNNQYIRKNGGSWRKINTESVTGFFQLIMEIPGDADEDLFWDPLRNKPGRSAYFPAPDIQPGSQKSMTKKSKFF